MLYDKSRQEFSKEEFCSPSVEYRGTPFWSWNCLMTKEIARKQIMEFKQMGFGGFHIHVRVGLKNQYMDEDFLELVKYCNDVAKEQGLLCYLYDEDRYASGCAGGEVTKIIRYRSRHLRISREQILEYMIPYEQFAEMQNRNEKVRGCLLKKYDILVEGEVLITARMQAEDESGKWSTWYVYEEINEESPWCNNQTYVDAMKKEAIAEFISQTHDKYYDKLKDEFGKNIPSIFTDEPNIGSMTVPALIGDKSDIILPYTESLPETYEKLSGLCFFEALPYVIWNGPQKEYPLERYYYYESCATLFDEAYGSQIGKWCQEHGIMLTGHLLAEENLTGQISSAGEAMRQYAAYQLPGMDNLCDVREFSTAKQVASVVHQFGLEGMMSEEYGVTQWDYDFKGYKLSGDWQAALGVTLRVPHLAWASMNGEAKRDYPAAIGWQSPWYRDYRIIEDYFARVNYCMTRGVSRVKVAVLHPVESMWFYMGTGVRQSQKRKELEAAFKEITETLLLNGVDFDYVSEELWSREVGDEQGKLTVGKMQYDVLLIFESVHLRKETFEKLQKLAISDHSKVIFVGQYPKSIGKEVVSEGQNLFSAFQRIDNSSREILKVLEPYRELEIYKADGTRATEYLYQIREEGGSRWIFIAQAWNPEKSRGEKSWTRKALHTPQNLTIQIKGIWKLKVLDALTGEIYSVQVEWEKGNTVYRTKCYRTDSLLLCLEPVENIVAEESATEVDSFYSDSKIDLENLHSVPFEQPIAYENEEPNVFLLDTFSYVLNEGEYQEATELLRADNIIRAELGYPLRMESVVQPYIYSDESRPHMVHLKTSIWSELELENCTLALEESEYCRIYFNQEELPIEVNGFYVDSAIKIISLPKIKKGENILEIHMQYGEKSNLEWMYLLGEFGVELRGAQKYLIKKPEQLYWGDYTRQGFPFYTGNMTYLVKTPKCMEDKKQILQIPYFEGTAVRLEGCGYEKKIIAFLPYAEFIESSEHQSEMLALTLLGNRYNGFGQLHMIGDDINWLGPDSWRSEGTSWSDTYQIKPMGILTAPLLYEK